MRAARLCGLEGCERRHHGGGYCQTHHMRQWKHGLVGGAEMQKLYGATTAERLRHYSLPADNGTDCRVWTGGKDGSGYGRGLLDGKKQYAHRAAWELANGPIPDGMQIDHVCNRRACVTADHLQLVTNRQNSQLARLRGERCSTAEAIEIIDELTAAGLQVFVPDTVPTITMP